MNETAPRTTGNSGHDNVFENDYDHHQEAGVEGDASPSSRPQLSGQRAKAKVHFRSELRRPLKKGEVFSGNPPQSNPYDQHKKRQARQNMGINGPQNKKGELREKWEDEETNLYEQAMFEEDQLAYEQHFKEACQKILNPGNVIELKKKTGELEKNYEELEERIHKAMTRIHELRKQIPSLQATSASLDEWQPGWREQATTEIERQIKPLEEKIQTMSDERRKIVKRRDQLIEEYVQEFDPEGSLPVDGDLWHELNDDMWEELDRLYDLSIEELETLATAENKPEDDDEDNSTPAPSTPAPTPPPTPAPTPAPTSTPAPVTPAPVPPTPAPTPVPITPAPTPPPTPAPTPAPQSRSRTPNPVQDIINEITAADKIIDRNRRRKTLSTLALKHSGVINPANGRDLGIEAAERLARSKTRRKLNPRKIYLKSSKDHDWVLKKMAEAKGNLEAAKYISHGKTRNKVLLGRAISAEDNGKSADAESILKSMHGRGKSAKRAEGIAYIATKRNDPNLINAINGLRHIRKRDRALVNIAIDTYSRGDKKGAARVINKIRNPDYKAEARQKIAGR